MTEIARVVLLERIVNRNRSVEIFLVPESSNAERRHGRVGQVFHNCLTLPELIPVGMREVVVPRRYFAVQILRVDVGERTEREIPVVRVVTIEREPRAFLRRLEQRGVL